MASKSIHNNPQSSPQSPNPTHVVNMVSNSSSSGMSSAMTALILFTALVAIAGGIYMSGYADDVRNFLMEKFFKAEAKAEEKALEKAGATKEEESCSIK